MIQKKILPRILIIDDLFGRIDPNGRNHERENLCGQYMLKDVTDDDATKNSSLIVKHPIAETVFHRGQTPKRSNIGETVKNDLEGTLEFISKGWDKRSDTQQPWSMIFLDLCFHTGKVTPKSNAGVPGMPQAHPDDSNHNHYFGLKILKEIHTRYPDPKLPVIILSSQPKEEIKRIYSQFGALGFLPRQDKDVNVQEMERYINKFGLIPDPTQQIVGYSLPLLLALREARKAARNRLNLLILGESGTGKSFLISYIKNYLQRENKDNFVHVPAPMLGADLWRSELFGYVKGAFTGATTGKKGLLKKAHKGDIFFDEIKDMAPEVQAGILTVLEDKKFIPIGADKPDQVDVRFISATNADIEAMTMAGDFRIDLLNRLRQNKIITLPPLRKRQEDIPLLVNKFIEDAEAQTGDTRNRQIEQDTIVKILNYEWRGNIRTLRDCIHKAVISSEVEFIYPHHIEIPEDEKAYKITITSPKDGEQIITLLPTLAPEILVNHLTPEQTDYIIKTKIKDSSIDDVFIVKTLAELPPEILTKHLTSEQINYIIKTKAENFQLDEAYIAKLLFALPHEIITKYITTEKLIHIMEHHQIERSKKALTGLLPELQKAFGQLIGNCGKTTFELYNQTRAISILCNKKLTTPQAYDATKRIYSVHPETYNNFKNNDEITKPFINKAEEARGITQVTNWWDK